MEKKFETLSDLIKDTYFIQAVNKHISKTHNRPAPKPGFHYKRGWYEMMYDAGNLRAEYFVQNIESIWNKTSNLSSELRRGIQFVCDCAMQDTLLFYAKLEADSKKAELKAKEVVKDEINNVE